MSNHFTTDSFTTVKRSGWLGNIVGACIGAGVGALIFLFALGLIWVGEGRTNMALVAQASIPAPVDRIDPANAGRLVAVTGQIDGAPLGDGQFLAPGAYLRLERRVEMFAWVEEKRTDRDDTVGGSTTERTTYSYTKEWTAAPASGDDFYRPAGHRNPDMPIGQAELSAEAGRIGAYDLKLAALDLPSLNDLRLTPQMVRPDDRWELAGRYIFMGAGALERPQLGDLRISYLALPAGLQATVFGEQRGDGLASYRTAQGDELYRALPYDRAGALKYLSTEDTFIDWIIRLSALLLLWVGLALVLGPINAIIGVLPALKQASGCLTAMLAFVPAFAVWALAELIAIMAHNLWLLLGAVLLALAVAVFAGRRFLPAPPAPQVA